jgi:hypothetical protein
VYIAGIWNSKLEILVSNFYKEKNTMKKLFEFALVGIVAFVGGTMIPSARTDLRGRLKSSLRSIILWTA